MSVCGLSAVGQYRSIGGAAERHLLLTIRLRVEIARWNGRPPRHLNGLDYNDLAMVKKLRVHAADLRGVNQLTIAGIAGVVDLVEAMHHQIASVPRMIAKPKRDRTTGITRLVYRSIHGVVGLVGHGLDRSARAPDAVARRAQHVAGARGAARRAERRARRLPGGIGQPAGDHHVPARGGIALPARTRAAGRGDPASRRQAGRAAARPVHERPAMEAQADTITAPRWRATSRTRRSICTTTAGSTSPPTGARSPSSSKRSCASGPCR